MRVCGPESPGVQIGRSGAALLVALLVFLYRTWVGKGLRAVSQDRQAAAVAGINPDSMNTLAFGLGAMLAGISGASLVQVFAWLPQVGIPAAARSFVIIVLGGMGSLPGAFLGGLMVQGGLSMVTVKLALILVFILFTSPTATYALANALYGAGVRPVGRDGRQCEIVDKRGKSSKP